MRGYVRPITLATMLSLIFSADIPNQQGYINTTACLFAVFKGNNSCKSAKKDIFTAWKKDCRIVRNAGRIFPKIDFGQKKIKGSAVYKPAKTG